VGNKEAFFAAIKAGCDAIYLGLRQFSARDRADNFALEQLPFLIDYAHTRAVKVFITINTLIKNSEISTLIHLLGDLEKLEVDSVIIQDLGVYYLVHKYFSQLDLHASTQMGLHNSCDCLQAKRMGFSRVVLPRELTKDELEIIATNAKIDLEVFVHGALCFSFSGSCLFSSFIGGYSANRGKCKQPCRRKFDNKFLFNLKDLQLFEYMNFIQKIGIVSAKIEGRMKSAEYVYNVVQSYKNMKEEPQDFARKKTSYFLGKQVENAVSPEPYAGIFVGKISSFTKTKFTFETNFKIKKRQRIRIMPNSGEDSLQFKIDNLDSDENKVTIYFPNEYKNEVKIGNKIFLVGEKSFPIPQKIAITKSITSLSKNRIENIIKSIKPLRYRGRELFVKIDSLDWLRKINFSKIDKLILAFSKTDLENLDLKKRFLQQNREKLIIELPKFIPEKAIKYYKNLVVKLYKFFLSNGRRL